MTHINHRVFSDEEELEVVTLYNSGDSAKTIAIKMGKGTDGTVLSVLKRRGVPTRTKAGMSAVANPYSLDEIKGMYEEGLSLQNIADKIGFKSAHSILNMFKACTYDTRTKAGSANMSLDHTYFSVLDTERKAYFAGFLLSDGNVSERVNSQPSIRMELATYDGYILEELRKDLRLDNEITRSSRKDTVKIHMHSTQIFNDLAKYGVVPNKTCNKVLDLNAIPKENHRHFLRGVFDGNGCISNSGGRIVISLYDGKDILDYIANYLHNEIGIKEEHAHPIRGNRCLYILYSAKNDVAKLVPYLYEDATIYLTRKFEKL